MPLIRHGILTRSGWFDYPDGKEYKCPKALQEAVKLTPTVPIVIGHPDGNHITEAATVVGVAYPQWSHEDHAVKARYEFYEDRLANVPDLLSHLKQGRHIGVSPGFNTVLTPFRDGHAQTEVLFNHVALTDVPRCEVPACGVLDSRVDRVGPSEEAISPPKSDEIMVWDGVSASGDYYNMTPEPKTDTEACIKEKMDKGMSKEEAEKACAPKKDDAKTDEDVQLPDDVTALQERLKVVEEQLARADALVTALEPMSEALRTSLVETKKFTADELKDKNYAELVWLKTKFDSPETPLTVLPPSGLPDSRTLKTEQVGNKRYRYPEKLRSRE